MADSTHRLIDRKEDTELIALQTNYRLALKQIPPTNKKNDKDWLKQKIKDAEQKIIEEIDPKKGIASQKDGAVEIYDNQGKLVRVYTKAEHGEQYRVLAEQFCLKHKYKL